MSFYDVIPASLQGIMQNGLLEGVFRDALVPLFLFDELADIKPWGANRGAESIMTRAGLMTPSPNPVTGGDAPVGNYGFERYSMTMDQYGTSIDTNMAESAMSLASKFLEDNHTLGIHAAESLNLVAQNALYAAFGTGRTWVVSGGAQSATTVVVDDARGFTQSVQNLATTGQNAAEGLAGDATPTVVAVSGSAPLNVTLNGVANTVTGADTTTNTLTLGTPLAVALTAGEAVVASTAPVSYRPSARASANDLVSGDIATLALFNSAVTRLRNSNVKPVRGAYQARVSPNTIEELYEDPAFQRVYTGRADSPAYRGLRVGDNIGGGAEFMGRFAGMDWVMDTTIPTGTTTAGVPYQRDIVAGQGCLIKGPFERMADLVAQENAGGTVHIEMLNGVARILRAPLDRFGQVYSSTWSWIGGYSVGTDVLTGDSAIYKRAVVLEHA